MTVNWVIAALLISMGGAAALGFCAMRLSAAFSAVALRWRVRRHPGDASVVIDAENVFSAAFFGELRGAAHRLALALLAALALLGALWFFGTGPERTLSLTLMEAFAIAACGLYFIGQLTRLTVGLLPVALTFRRELVSAMRCMNFTLFLLAVLYVMGCWAFSL